TKVRVSAWMSEHLITQLREIGGGGLIFTQKEPVAAFGLGPATNAADVTVEWPSGVVQKFTSVSAFQFLHVTASLVRITPAHTNVPAGSTVAFGLSEPVTGVQWYRDNTLLPGETNATLTITNVRAGDLGRYTARVYDPASGCTIV